jgi:hypothetical protein
MPGPTLSCSLNLASWSPASAFGLRPNSPYPAQPAVGMTLFENTTMQLHLESNRINPNGTDLVTSPCATMIYRDGFLS